MSAERTSRCRLYLLKKEILFGKDLYTEVWDSIEWPYPENSLPKGELAATFTGTEAEIRKQLDNHRREQGFYLRGDWTSRGSI